MNIFLSDQLGRLLIALGLGEEVKPEAPKAEAPKNNGTPEKPLPILKTKVFEDAKPVYKELWERCIIQPEKMDSVKAVCDKIVSNKSRYEEVSKVTGVPWDVIACIHNLECGGRFDRHMHEGSPLTGRTLNVPKGRPVKGNPPFTWFDSAVDALGYDGLTTQKDWSIERTLHMLQAYNGFGYVSKGINSPYLWSFSNNYSKGKFIADSKYSADAVSQQVGAACILKILRKV